MLLTDLTTDLTSPLRALACKVMSDLLSLKTCSMFPVFVKEWWFYVSDLTFQPEMFHKTVTMVSDLRLKNFERLHYS